MIDSDSSGALVVCSCCILAGRLRQHLWKRHDDLVDDLHRKVIRFLLTSFDIIVLPAFDTSRLVRRSDDTSDDQPPPKSGQVPDRDKRRWVRRMTKSTVQGMLHLSHGTLLSVLFPVDD
jgi:hypothetical protein